MIGGGAAAKYTSESYDILRCNCNHFTEVSKTVWQAEGCEHCNSKAVLHLLQQQGSTPLVARLELQVWTAT